MQIPQLLICKISVIVLIVVLATVVKYFIESNGKSGSYREWVLDTQLEPKDVPLPSEPEDQ